MRSIDANFGDRLANARNLAHTEVPPAPPREQNRTSMGYIALEAATSIREAARIPPGVSRYKWENGSYRSPFDYNIPRHSISGDNIALAQSISYTPSSGRPQNPSFGSMPSVDTRTPPNMAIYETETETEMGEEKMCRAVTPGPNVSVMEQFSSMELLTNG